jgi:thiol:disulfide interchange protein
VLAVAIASPCTAPFMGAALGAALTQTAPMALLLFAVLGAGMAFPYLLASLWPGFARAMPRPGPWMVRFKVIMAFPMFATVVWLVWVLGQQTGIDGVAALLGVLVAAAFAAWALATPASAGARRALAAAAAVVLVAVGVWAWPGLQGVAPAAPGAQAAGWQPWSEQAVADARSKGQPVFVDFTAAWCVTCQVNKRTALADAAVVRDFADKGVLLLRADWTRRDEAITRELARHGRSGVPVYLYYSKAAAAPQLLSELLTVDEVRAALAQN